LEGTEKVVVFIKTILERLSKISFLLNRFFYANIFGIDLWGSPEGVIKKGSFYSDF